MDPILANPEYAHALHVVRRVVGEIISPERLSMIPHKCYVPIVVDGNPCQTLCRLYKTPNLYVGTISPRKVETRFKIHDASEIARFAGEMMETARKYNGNA